MTDARHYNTKKLEGGVWSWGGWVLEGTVVKSPRKVRLTPAEAVMMSVLLEHREKCRYGGMATKQPAGDDVYLTPEELTKRTGAPSIATMRTIVTTLRHAIGRESLVAVRGVGYILMNGHTFSPAAVHPINELITKLQEVLKIAKRVQQSINTGVDV